ncbi:MAG: PhoH family protein [Candidatus Omnitrophica bacterium]|jgi:phosphate starvation-inducible PhoH-like protein|nr:PhoH family protein [Candidatus Omnitrophota bacterium]MDD5078145.1 PhoH family protein [Candidatus Omnitrophota bacterium]MDD5725336.1 PhoH family protein [Candidatus Omnitrophota bacterium]
MDKIIRFESQRETQELFGAQDINLKNIEKEFRVKLILRGEHLKVSGAAAKVKKAAQLIEHLLGELRSGSGRIDHTELSFLISNLKKGGESFPADLDTGITRSCTGKQIGPRTPGQREYVEAIKENDIVFGIGPAGTGKTYLAMASAVEALRKQEVRRIILTRPAIEAGESLGFLPGDMQAKISPYLRPLYDALYDMMEARRIENYIETGIIEVAPLAYMRGRTLNDAFIILDEAQNCTAEQMKMFLTRLGFDSKAVITGDITQSDLPGAKPIGLIQAQESLKDIKEIKFIYFGGADVVRHSLVQKIIQAYEKNA